VTELSTANAVVAATIDAALRDAELAYEQIEPGIFTVQLPGEQRLKTTCWLSIGRHALAIEAFVMRKPDENREAFYSYLLQRNTRSYAVSWAIDELGDIYLSGRLPLHAVTADEIDQVLGSVLTNADENFNALLELGFGSSIRREWAWRVKAGESLRNLEAFRDFVGRSQPDPDRPPASGD
jgi:hypothetical protein